jgi:hypothetical protein
LFSGERPENKKAHHGSLYISAISAEIYNLHSLRPQRLCGKLLPFSFFLQHLKAEESMGSLR